MAISPFSARPGGAEGERRRARLALAIAAVGIAAILLAYALSPGVRHAVGHAAHSVRHAVGNVFDHDHGRDDRQHAKHRQHAEHRQANSQHAERRQHAERQDASSPPAERG